MIVAAWLAPNLDLNAMFPRYMARWNMTQKIAETEGHIPFRKKPDSQQKPPVDLDDVTDEGPSKARKPPPGKKNPYRSPELEQRFEERARKHKTPTPEQDEDPFGLNEKYRGPEIKKQPYSPSLKEKPKDIGVKENIEARTVPKFSPNRADLSGQKLTGRSKEEIAKRKAMYEARKEARRKEDIPPNPPFVAKPKDEL